MDNRSTGNAKVARHAAKDSSTRKFIAALALGVASAVGMIAQAHADTTLLNVSYDPTRELYQDVNQAFGKEWKAKSGESVKFKQSHGGSGAQGRAVLAGL